MGFLDRFRRRARATEGSKIAMPASPEEGDLLVIEQLRRAGADLSIAREVQHYLYFRRQDLAAGPASKLRGEGFEVEVRAAATGDDWLALARHRIVVDPATVASLRSRLAALATSLGGEYDGWEAAVS